MGNKLSEVVRSAGKSSLTVRQDGERLYLYKGSSGDGVETGYDDEDDDESSGGGRRYQFSLTAPLVGLGVGGLGGGAIGLASGKTDEDLPDGSERENTELKSGLKGAGLGMLTGFGAGLVFELVRYAVD